jgi:hypothetical protein
VQLEYYRLYYKPCYKEQGLSYCLKVLKGIISAGCCARCLVGVLFLDPRSWVLWLLLRGRFVPGSSFLGIMLVAC